jgi:hypothetical protein
VDWGFIDWGGWVDLAKVIRSFITLSHFNGQFSHSQHKKRAQTIEPFFTGKRSAAMY